LKIKQPHNRFLVSSISEQLIQNGFKAPYFFQVYPSYITFESQRKDAQLEIWEYTAPPHLTDVEKDKQKVDALKRRRLRRKPKTRKDFKRKPDISVVK
jgi:hypothetical protein